MSEHDKVSQPTNARTFTVNGQYCYWVTPDGPSLSITPDDARLINNALDTAPRLLAALKEVVRISDRKHDAWYAARTAIAEAEGSST